MFKHWIYIFFFFFSCSNEVSEKPADSEESTDTVGFEDLIVNEEEDSSNLAIHNDFQIEDMPQKWIGLTDISNGEGEFAIEKYCDASTPELQFVQEDEGWNFICLWGQDGDSWKIETFDAQVTDNFGSELIKGYFVLKNQLVFPSDTINFSWQTGQKMCQFTELSMPSEYFVSEANTATYPIKEENCDDFFDEP